MSKLEQVKVLSTEKTIVLMYKGETLNLQKDSTKTGKYYKAVSDLLEKIEQGEKSIDSLVEQFINTKQAIENYTKGNFTIEGGKLVLKGDDEVMPSAISKKLLLLKTEGEDYMPLIRFWKKLKKNPSEASRQQLFKFIEANNIPITELGDIVVEKGVTDKGAGFLVDSYSEQIDNSVGMIVEMPREKVDPNPDRTCSFGLHVAAPDYVRSWYKNQTIVECLVNPADVVAVPRDYNETKMRVCRYQIVSYAKNSPRKETLAKFDDVVKVLSPERKRMEGYGKVKLPTQWQSKMTAQEIVDFIYDKFGEDLSNMSLKNKQSIIKKAEKIIAESEKKLNWTGKTCKEIISIVKNLVGVDLGGKNPKNARRGKVIKKALRLLEDNGYSVIRY